MFTRPVACQGFCNQQFGALDSVTNWAKAWHEMAKALTENRIKRAGPGRHSDMFGLSLQVAAGGSRQWVWRGCIRGSGERVTISMGAQNEWDTDEAREQALAWRKAARSGRDPRHQSKAARPTLAKALDAVIEAKAPTWKKPKRNAARYRSIVDTYAGKLTGRQLDTITTAEVEATLLRIWHDKPATGQELQRYLSACFAWGMVHGYCETDPADLVKSQLPKVHTVTHQKALHYSDLSTAIERVNESNAYQVSKLALEFLALTAVRTANVLEASWDEIDKAARTWTIPAERMKGRKGKEREHRVPLSDRAMAILRAAEPFSADGRVFASPTGKTLSHGTLNKLMRDLKLGGTPHGLRATFRDWAAECTDAPEAVCEACLAHVYGSSTARSYRRTDYLEKRRELMQQWALYVAAENVLPLRRSA